MKALFVLGSVLLGLALGLLAITFGAYTVSVLWTWFVAPMGLPAISTAQAYGLCLVASLIRSGFGTRKDDSRSGGEMLLSVLITCSVSLGIGWLVHHFFMV